MEWLTDNWLWILLGIGFVWLFSRCGGMGCGMGGHGRGTHRHGEPKKEAEERTTSPRTGCH